MNAENAPTNAPTDWLSKNPFKHSSQFMFIMPFNGPI